MNVHSLVIFFKCQNKTVSIYLFMSKQFSEHIGTTENMKQTNSKYK